MSEHLGVRPSALFLTYWSRFEFRLSDLDIAFGRKLIGISEWLSSPDFSLGRDLTRLVSAEGRV